MEHLRPHAEHYHNPSREYISRLLSTLQQYYSMSEISRRVGVNRTTIYNYLRDESEQRFIPCPYSVQFLLEELVNNLTHDKPE